MMAKLDTTYVSKYLQSGDGVSQDLVTAHKWFNLAAMNGIEEARENRAEISLDMSAQEIAKAQKMAREWIMGR